MIDLRFVLGYDASAFLISVRTHGRFSHCDAIVPKGGIPNIPWKAGSLVGARSDRVGGMPPGLQCRPCGYESVRSAVIFHLPASIEQATAFWAFLFSQEGHAYDEQGIIAFVFNTNWHKPGAFFCSAAILDALQSADWLSPLYSPYTNVAPVALADLVAAKGATWEEDPRITEQLK